MFIGSYGLLLNILKLIALSDYHNELFKSYICWFILLIIKLVHIVDNWKMQKIFYKLESTSKILITKNTH